MDIQRKFLLSKENADLEVDEEAIQISPMTNPKKNVGIDQYQNVDMHFQSDVNNCANKDKDLPIYQAKLPNGQNMPLLKTLLTSVCERDCYYCFSRAGRDCHRFTFKPEELANTFLQINQAGIAKGIFLSSGVVGGGVRTQDRLLDTAEILRIKLRYRGYLHLKIMPGAERAQVERAMQLADRVSINLEAPNSERLKYIAPQKLMLDELLTPLRWIDEIRQQQPGHKGWLNRWPSSTTQFVVGGGEETDLEYLKATDYLYHHLHLSRAYYSGFKPLEGTPLEHKPAVNLWRKIRLYQASFLLREYKFTVSEIPLDSSENLLLYIDPKLAWAQQNLIDTPVDINHAGIQDLIRVPGIGLRGAQAIIHGRKFSHLYDLRDLSALGLHSVRSAPFILFNGKRPPFQLKLL